MQNTVMDLLQPARPLVIGHRGYCALAPENTLSSFSLALKAGADLIELDYHHDKNGVPVVIHDETLDRTTNARTRWQRSKTALASTTAAEWQTLDAGSWFAPRFAGEKIPLLTEALDLIQAGGGTPLIEHKSGNAETLACLLRKRKLINRVVLISFDWSFLRGFHELEPDQLLGALGPPERLTHGGKPPRFFRSLNSTRLDELRQTGAKIVVWNRRVSTRAILLARQQKLKVWVYTVNDASLAARLTDRGVEGIITNEIVLIQKALSNARP